MVFDIFLFTSTWI